MVRCSFGDLCSVVGRLGRGDELIYVATLLFEEIVILIDGTERNVIESKVIVTELLLCYYVAISITPKLNFIENNQTKKFYI